MPLRAFARVEDQFERKDLLEEFLLFQRSTGRIHVLNGSARSIYLLCDGSRTENDIARALAEEYEIDATTALRDVQRTIESLLQVGAVRPC